MDYPFARDRKHRRNLKSRWVDCPKRPGWAPWVHAKPWARSAPAAAARGRTRLPAGGWPGPDAARAGRADRQPFGSEVMLRRRFGRSQLYVQLFELGRVHRAGRPEHEVLVALRFREWHHVADVVRARDAHEQTVDTRGNSAVRRDTV